MTYISSILYVYRDYLDNTIVIVIISEDGTVYSWYDLQNLPLFSLFGHVVTTTNQWIWYRFLTWPLPGKGSRIERYKVLETGFDKFGRFYWIGLNILQTVVINLQRRWREIYLMELPYIQEVHLPLSTSHTNKIFMTSLYLLYSFSTLPINFPTEDVCNIISPKKISLSWLSCLYLYI